MALHVVARRLFNMSYVDGGCVGEPPEGTTYDDTVGCYMTNYTIGLAGMLGAVLMLASGNKDTKHVAFGLLFFLGKGCGYSVAGVLHHVIHTQEASEDQSMWWKIAFILTLLGNCGICFVGVQMLVDTCKSLASCSTLLYGLVGAFYAVVIALVAITNNMLATGVATLVGLVFVFVVYFARGEIVAAVAILVLVVGFVLQLLLAPTCGDPGYENCWKDCILPAPHFNHNALFHVCITVGMLILTAVLPQQAKSYKEIEGSEDDSEYSE